MNRKIDSQEEIVSIIDSILGPSFKLIKGIIEQFTPSFNLSSTFWGLLSILIIISAILLNWVSISKIALIILGLLIIEVVGSNLRLIKRWLAKEKKEEFLKSISKESVSSVLDFIENKTLTPKELKIILSSKFAKQPVIIKKIISAQDYDFEFIEFFVRKKLYKKTDNYSYARLIGGANHDFPKKTFIELLKFTRGFARGALLGKNNSFVSTKNKNWTEKIGLIFSNKKNRKTLKIIIAFVVPVFAIIGINNIYPLYLITPFQIITFILFSAYVAMVFLTVIITEVLIKIIGNFFLRRLFEYVDQHYKEVEIN